MVCGKKRVFDAHEYFTEVPELVGRPFVRSVWNLVAKVFVPRYGHAYTVGPALAERFTKAYSIPFSVVRNVPVVAIPGSEKIAKASPPVILYQGALNDGRGIEATLEAMQTLDGVQLWLAGEGDLSVQLRELARKLGVESRVRFLGYVKPADLKAITNQAWLGLNLLENKGLSYYYSLANKFFDCVQAGVPLLTMDFPEYRALNQVHRVAVLLERAEPGAIAEAISVLLNNPERYDALKAQCAEAAGIWNWEQEKPVLLAVWKAVFQPMATR
jgi:glycosyltransferase involved in cell wall biosynthesis